MRKLIVFSLAVLGLYSCSNQHSGSDMVYGAPEATVTSAPNDVKLKGPLGFAATVPPLMSGDTIDVKFDATHMPFHIGRDIIYKSWTFGDSIPGPTLHVKVGQTIRFSLTDRSNDTMRNQMMHMNMQPMQHSIDFHAAMVNPSDKYRSLQPGETIQFLWTANYPGVFMYHCATPSVLVHIGNGMFGAVIVEPADGYPTTVDTSFMIVQNEYYVKQQGDLYTFDTLAARQRQPSYVTFNGKVGRYILHPLRVKAGKRIRVYFLNVGPNNPSTFHVIGTILDKVWLDGNPKNELTGMQSVLVGPAGAMVAEFVLPEPGRYPFVDHSFANAEAGATGEFLAE